MFTQAFLVEKAQEAVVFPLLMRQAKCWQRAVYSCRCVSDELGSKREEESFWQYVHKEMHLISSPCRQSVILSQNGPQCPEQIAPETQLSGRKWSLCQRGTGQVLLCTFIPSSRVPWKYAIIFCNNRDHWARHLPWQLTPHLFGCIQKAPGGQWRFIKDYAKVLLSNMTFMPVSSESNIGYIRWADRHDLIKNQCECLKAEYS